MSETPFGDRIKSGTTDSILASLYRTILHDIKIDIDYFNYLIELELASVHATNIVDRSMNRDNLRNDLLKSTMTWRVFCKGIAFIRVQSIEFVLYLHHYNREVTVHRTTIDLTVYDPTQISRALASFYHQILYELAINTAKFNRLLNDYLALSTPRATNVKSKTISRAGLKKELTKDTMMWRVFCKGLRFIHVQKFDLELTLTHRNLTTTTHRKSITMSPDAL